MFYSLTPCIITDYINYTRREDHTYQGTHISNTLRSDGYTNSLLLILNSFAVSTALKT